jgi:hypothetical protein
LGQTQAKTALGWEFFNSLLNSVPQSQRIEGADSDFKPIYDNFDWSDLMPLR